MVEFFLFLTVRGLPVINFKNNILYVGLNLQNDKNAKQKR